MIRPEDAEEVAILARQKFEKEQEKLEKYRCGAQADQADKWMRMAQMQGVALY